MRALVTGATGLLAGSVLPALDAIWECWPVGHRKAPPHPRGEVIELEDASAVAALVRRVRPAVVLHLAALADVDACERAPDLAWRANVVATRNLARAVAEADEPVFVYVSTDQLYDSPGANSEDRARPRNVYALTKLWGEDAAALAHNTVVLRANFFCLPAGGRPGLVGWLAGELAANRPVNVFHDVMFNPIYAGAVPDILRRIVGSGVRGVFNLGASGPALSKADFARGIAAAFGYPASLLRDASVADGDLKAYRPRDMVMDVSRLANAIGPLPTIGEGIAALRADWQRGAAMAVAQ